MEICEFWRCKYLKMLWYKPTYSWSKFRDAKSFNMLRTLSCVLPDMATSRGKSSSGIPSFIFVLLYLLNKVWPFAPPNPKLLTPGIEIANQRIVKIDGEAFTNDCVFFGPFHWICDDHHSFFQKRFNRFSRVGVIDVWWDEASVETNQNLHRWGFNFLV